MACGAALMQLEGHDGQVESDPVEPASALCHSELCART